MGRGGDDLVLQLRRMTSNGNTVVRGAMLLHAEESFGLSSIADECQNGKSEIEIGRNSRSPAQAKLQHPSPICCEQF
jgi:hypothetical protein